MKNWGTVWHAEHRRGTREEGEVKVRQTYDHQNLHFSYDMCTLCQNDHKSYYTVVSFPPGGGITVPVHSYQPKISIHQLFCCFAVSTEGNDSQVKDWKWLSFLDKQNVPEFLSQRGARLACASSE